MRRKVNVIGFLRRPGRWGDPKNGVAAMDAFFDITTNCSLNFYLNVHVPGVAGVLMMVSDDDKLPGTSWTLVYYFKSCIVLRYVKRLQSKES
jgi:hypothetical protein